MNVRPEHYDAPVSDCAIGTVDPLFDDVPSLLNPFCAKRARLFRRQECRRYAVDPNSFRFSSSVRYVQFTKP